MFVHDKIKHTEYYITVWVKFILIIHSEFCTINGSNK